MNQNRLYTAEAGKLYHAADEKPELINPINVAAVSKKKADLLDATMMRNVMIFIIGVVILVIVGVMWEPSRWPIAGLTCVIAAILHLRNGKLERLRALEHGGSKRPSLPRRPSYPKNNYR